MDSFSFLLPRNVIGHMLGLEPSTFVEGRTLTDDEPLSFLFSIPGVSPPG